MIDCPRTSDARNTDLEVAVSLFDFANGASVLTVKVGTAKGCELELFSTEASREKEAVLKVRPNPVW